MSISMQTHAIEMGGSAGCIAKLNFMIENTSEAMRGFVEPYFTTSIPNFYELLDEIRSKYEGFEDMATMAFTDPTMSELIWFETFNCARQLQYDGYLINFQ